MVKTRLVACLLWRNGSIVQSVGFRHTNIIGSASTAVDFFNIWGVDEIVLLDVTRTPSAREAFYETLETLSRRCMVPLTVGGWVTDTDEIRQLLKTGADKVAINTAGYENPDFITEASTAFGRQCIVVSIDASTRDDGSYQVVIDRGNEHTGKSVSEWAGTAEDAGAGEIFLTSIDRDGSQDGYDIDLIQQVTSRVDIPVVASGGAGEWNHLVEAVREGNADAVSVANRFHHIQHSTRKAKEHMIDSGLNVREPYFYDVDVSRRPSYEVP